MFSPTDKLLDLLTVLWRKLAHPTIPDIDILHYHCLFFPASDPIAQKNTDEMNAHSLNEKYSQSHK